jgi:hypothetical protein
MGHKSLDKNAFESQIYVKRLMAHPVFNEAQRSIISDSVVVIVSTLLVLPQPRLMVVWQQLELAVPPFC